MRLEDMTVVLRPRQTWEAVDLGCAMVRRDFGRLMALWVGTVFPLWAVVCVLLRDDPVWIPLVVWWLKPLYDRVPLFCLSRAAFGERPSFVETLRSWPRMWSTGIFSALLWRRLSFIRSFALPAQMLEGLRGSAAGRRVKILATDGGGSGFSLSYAFSNIELFCWLGFMFGTYGLLPASAKPDWSGMFQALDFETTIPKGFLWWGAACHMVIVSLVEPFYVGAGFALYLNCRTRIEGWDVELEFRRMASRLTAAVLLVLCCTLPGALAVAAESGDAAQTIREVLRHPDFEIHKIKTRQWVMDSKGDMDSEPSGEGFEIVGVVGEVLFWGIATGLLVWLVVYLVKNRHLFISRRAGQAPVKVPTVVMGMEITRESLPEDIEASARAAWEKGEFKEALSLLYRGSLSWLVRHRHLPISDSDTEEDCLAQVSSVGGQGESAYFKRLTGAWVQVAYALLPVSDAEMRSLCDLWPFAEKGGRA